MTERLVTSCVLLVAWFIKLYTSVAVMRLVVPVAERSCI